jgi:hypothetical protein
MSDISLSMDNGRRLCTIVGGKLNGECIYLYDKRFVCCSNCNDKCKGKCCADCGKKNYHNTDLKDIVDYCHLEDGVFQQVPSNIKSQSDCIMINGKRGSGKSVYMSKFLEQYRLLNPKNKIYLFSQCKSDQNLDKLIDQRFDLDDYVKNGGITPEEFPDNCCVCFDDVDMLDNSKPDRLRDQIFKIMNSLIQLSRKRGITVIQTSHLTTNHGETKHVLNGASSFTFFLNAISHQIKNALKLYMGLNKEQIKKVTTLQNSRFCTIFLTSPTVCMTEKELFILKD